MDNLNRPNAIKRVIRQLHKINDELRERESTIRYGYSFEVDSFQFVYCEGTLLTTAKWIDITGDLTIDEAWGFVKELSRQCNIVVRS